MLKYIDIAIVMQEIPDEISLAFEITNCPHRCENCHSSHLQADIGYPLTNSVLDQAFNTKGVSNILLMGGDADHQDIKRIAEYIHKNSSLKVSLYSGDDEIDLDLKPYLDYYKIGHYDKEKGPLNKETTNQKLYKIVNNRLINITKKFWKKI